jgi:hypothetical protein
MNVEYYQPMLFSNMQSNELDRRSYQIKSLDDPSFGVTLSVSGEDDPETLALEKLGYFVVPEFNVV